MDHRERLECPTHGTARKRQSCQTCNAAYMRIYMRRRRAEHPEIGLVDRARERAARNGIPFSLSVEDIQVPARCPVLGLPLVVGAPRSDSSPSLDRIEPQIGYVRGNVRVISNKANYLKGGKSLDELRLMTKKAPVALRSAYAKIADYVAREALLRDVRLKAAGSDARAGEWRKVASFLDDIFNHYPVRLSLA